jgi:hypothetical protein
MARENKKISITTYSQQKLILNVRKVRSKPVDQNEEATDPDGSVEPRVLEAESAASGPGKNEPGIGEKK